MFDMFINAFNSATTLEALIANFIGVAWVSFSAHCRG